MMVLLSGCSDSITNPTAPTPSKYQALTEAQFNASSSLKAIPGAVIYDDLEHLNAPPDSVGNDTGTIGEDVIPYSYTETATHRIKLGAEAQFKARLVNESGAVIYQLVNPGDTALVSIPAGNYKLYLTSTINFDGAFGYSQPVFIQPDLDAINSGAGAPPQGGYNKDDLNTLLTTKKCIRCNLRLVQLHDKNLTGADLSEANLESSFMDHVNLSNAIFNHTEWTNAGANNSVYDSAKFIFTILNRTGFGSSSFIKAKFQRLNWDHTSFTNCDFRYATLDSGSASNGGLDGSDLRYTTISNLNLREMACEHTKFNQSTFSNVYSYEMYFPNSVMDSVKFINKCFFSRNTVRNTQLNYATFDDFRGDGSVWDGCVMTGSNITNSDFSGGSLRGATLIHTIWHTVNIYAVNMCHQDRSGSTFSDIHYNVDTDCWP